VLELYHNINSVCAQKVRIALKEKGQEAKEHILTLRGDQNEPTYLKLNPNGVVPTLVHDEHPIVESSLRFPFPGWNEGFTTAAPLVLMGGEGVKGWPVRKDGPLEIIPVDIVASGILIITANTLPIRP
jgi:hypothetical protein